MRTLALPCLTWKPAAAGDQPPPETTSSSPGTGCILGAPLPHLICLVSVSPALLHDLVLLGTSSRSKVASPPLLLPPEAYPGPAPAPRSAIPPQSRRASWRRVVSATSRQQRGSDELRVASLARVREKCLMHARLELSPSHLDQPRAKFWPPLSLPAGSVGICLSAMHL